MGSLALLMLALWPMPPVHPVMAKCQQALAAAPKIDPRARALHVQAACGALYGKRQCRGAWNDVAGTPKLFPDRWEHLQKWCSEAYCHELRGSKPAACEPKAEISEAAWLELNAALLKHEGLDPALADALQPYFREPGTEAWPAPIIDVREGKPAATVVIRPYEGGPLAPIALSGVPDAVELRAVQRAIAPVCRGAVTFRSEKIVPMRVLRPLFDAVAAAGCELQEFQTIPTGAK